MAGKRGRVEGTITVPDVDWTAELADPVAATVTISAGSYAFSELVDEFQLQLNAVGSQAYAVSSSDGENGNGRTTISAAGNFDIMWTNTDLRDVLGYTAGLSGSNAYLSDNHGKGLWLPDSVKKSQRGDNVTGNLQTDMTMAEGPSGATDYFSSASKTINSIEWQAVTRRRAVIEGELVENESLETFWRDVILGTQSYFETGNTLRVYWDADLPDYTEYNVAGDWFVSFDAFVQNLADGWTGLWSVNFARLIAGASGGNGGT